MHRHHPRPVVATCFLVWMAMLDEPMEVLGPPELVEAARPLGGAADHCGVAALRGFVGGA